MSQTRVSIDADRFLINGAPTYAGRQWQGQRIEGLLLNARLVQGIFDDLNPETRGMWSYPDTGEWDPERNTAEFLAAMPEWRRQGLLAFTLNLQGGSPQGYSKQQPWHNSAFKANGDLRPDYLARLRRILDRADELGMVVILGLFYFGQDHRLQDEAAVVRAVDNAVAWLAAAEYRHVLIEVNNECNVQYSHDILMPERVHELIQRVASTVCGGDPFLVGTSYGGGKVPLPNVIEASDFLLMHGNGVSDPNRIRAMVDECRADPAYRGQPVLINEDDHYAFELPDNNLAAAVSRYCSWGYFDFRRPYEPFCEGYQSVPADWGVNSPRKRAFFRRVAEITGAAEAGQADIKQA